MNSFKSACSFAKTTSVPFYQFEEDVEAFLGRQVCVELVVSLIGSFKSVEHLNDSIHGEDFTTPRNASTGTTRDARVSKSYASTAQLLTMKLAAWRDAIDRADTKLLLEQMDRHAC